MSGKRKLRVRQAQTVLPFGVGAVIDVQGESFVAAGIENWPPTKQLESVHSPRLMERLRLTGLYSAPAAPVPDFDVPDAAGPAFVRFPAWLFCGSCRKMTHWRIGDEKFGYPPECPSCSPRHRLTPMRFVQVCKDGHLSDVNWWYWAHSELSPEARERCPNAEALSFEAGDRATGLEALAVRCRHDTCKAARRDLLDILGPQPMRCPGRNPWQRFDEREECDNRVQIVQRTAGNVYYPVVHSALDIPAPEKKAPSVDNATADAVRNHMAWSLLCRQLDDPQAPALNKLIMDTTGADEALMRTLIEAETGKVPAFLSGGAVSAGPVGTSGKTAPEQASSHPDFSWEEWDAFTAPEPVSGPDFSIREMPVETSQEPPWSEIHPRISRVVVADRLREVRALRGFSRLSPDNRVLPVDLTRKRRWLPAIEVFGEGVFLTLDEARLKQWESLSPVRERVKGLRSDVARSFQKDRLPAFTGPVLLPRLPLLHTLGHLLIRQLSFESGYNTASLRERVYARSSKSGGTEGAQYGLLIYTASGDADGTMGGLARQGEPARLAETLLRLLEQAVWCSADPICSEHGGQGYSNLNRAACHACVLVPETSCEVGNIILDRALVVGGAGVPGFFEPVIEAARQEAVRMIDVVGGTL